MSAEEEKLEQVKAFSELRTGMLYVVRPCGHCGGSHRGQLLNLRPSGRAFETTTHVCAEAADDPRCRPDGRFCVSKTNVDMGIVYRVVDGYEGPEAYELAVLRDAAPKVVLRFKGRVLKPTRGPGFSS